MQLNMDASESPTDENSAVLFSLSLVRLGEYVVGPFGTLSNSGVKFVGPDLRRGLEYVGLTKAALADPVLRLLEGDCFCAAAMCRSMRGARLPARLGVFGGSCTFWVDGDEVILFS